MTREASSASGAAGTGAGRGDRGGAREGRRDPGGPEAEERAGPGEDRHRRHVRGGLAVGVRLGLAARGLPRKTDPCAFTKQARASAPVRASAGAAKRGPERVGARGAGPVEEAEVDEPLAREAVQRREARDRDGPGEEEERRLREDAAEAPHPVHVARPGDVDDLARPEEEERLEEAVVDDVEERARETEERPLRPARRAPREAGPEAEDDDPDVLDAVPGEEALEVVLPEGEGDAEDGRGDAEDEERVAPGRPAGRGRAR